MQVFKVSSFGFDASKELVVQSTYRPIIRNCPNWLIHLFSLRRSALLPSCSSSMLFIVNWDGKGTGGGGWRWDYCKERMVKVTLTAPICLTFSVQRRQVWVKFWYGIPASLGWVGVVWPDQTSPWLWYVTVLNSVDLLQCHPGSITPPPLRDLFTGVEQLQKNYLFHYHIVRVLLPRFRSNPC